MDDHGWGSDQVGKLTKLQAAVQVLAEGSGTTKTRLKAATDWLVHLDASHFPEHLRNRAASVLDFRRKHMFVAGDEVYFRDVPERQKEICTRPSGAVRGVSHRSRERVAALELYVSERC